MKVLLGAITNEEIKPEIKKMRHMKPFEVCVVVSGAYMGQVVMRTASKTHKEVICLTSPDIVFWEKTKVADIEVRQFEWKSITLNF